MIVSPDEISASKAPSTRPLKHCDTKFGPLIMARTDAPRNGARYRRRTRSNAESVRPAANRSSASGSGVVAELAAERVRLLHQRLARHDFEDLPVVLLVLHVLRRLALDDDDRADELVVFRAEVAPHPRSSGTSRPSRTA